MSMRKVPETPLTCEVRAALEEYTQRLMNIYPERFIESDPEAWREENLKKQAAGVKFQRKICGEWVHPINMFNFSGKKEDYREVPQEDLNLKQTGDKWYEMQIEQPAIGVISSFNKWDRALTEKEISDLFSGKVRPEDIPQEAPKVAATGIEPTPPTPHAAERALWKAQREAGTNEVWQTGQHSIWVYIPNDVEPQWRPYAEYRVKPMKLTARIARYGIHIGEIKIHDWEFYGTREEYRAECEKYGYVVMSEIKEVVDKPKTVTCYVVAIKASNTGGKEDVKNFLDKHCITIIGDIEEREVEA